jgi:hypothetical protein
VLRNVPTKLSFTEYSAASLKTKLDFFLFGYTIRVGELTGRTDGLFGRRIN